jgi:dTMP kinase
MKSKRKKFMQTPHVRRSGKTLRSKPKPKRRGLFIVIEGIDSSGKGTQLKLLSERIKRIGKDVITADFPRYYSSMWGRMCGELLTGKFGDYNKFNPYFSALPFMLDHYTWSRDVGRPWLDVGGVILLDRSFTSCVHQVAKMKTHAKNKYRQWIWPMGYKELGILKPDLVLVLDVSPDITKGLLKLKSERKYLHGRKKDQAEKNWSHQWAAYREYVYMTKTNKDWIPIKCKTRGVLDTPDAIHARIWAVVEKIIR